MCMLGQMQTYEHIMDLYQDYITPKHLKNTVMKLLVRCINGYTSIEKINKIFKMIKRHNRLFSMLEVKEKLKAKKAKSKQLNAFSDKKKASKDKSKNEKTEAEAKVAYFCMHACRLYTLIRAFNNECLIVVNQEQSVRKLCVMTQAPEEDLDHKTFNYGGSDYLEKLIEDVKSTKQAYQDQFKESIPVLTKTGKLVNQD